MDERTLAGKAVLVTGASRGIGRATALLLARAGARICLVSRSAKDLAAVAREVEALGAEVLTVPGDVTLADTCTAAVERAVAAFGGLFAVVNNAGVGHFGPLESLAETDFDQMLSVNLKAPWLMSRAAIPVMKRQGEGHLVMISSVAATTTFAGGGGYTASKWGLRALTETLMQEMKPYGIRVSSILPGSVRTGFGGTPPKEWAIAPERVADAVCYVLRSPASVIVNEVVLRPQVPR